MKNMTRLLCKSAGILLALSLMFAHPSVALSADVSYPSKPIRLILPYAPGATTDLVGRIIGPKLAGKLGQSVVAENRAGAGGDIGIEYTAKAPPDGYTIVLATNGLSLSPSLHRKLKYDPIKDLATISLVAQGHFVLLVRHSLPVNNLQELVEYAKTNPGKLNFGSGGIGSGTHLAGELLKSLARINIVHVPYKGATLAMNAMMGGEIDMVVIGTPSAAAQIQAGKVKALAVLSNERESSLPNVPTAKESGMDNYVVTSWFGILGPAGTPLDIVNRLNAEWMKVAAMPDTMEKMRNAGVEPRSGTPEQFSEFLKAEIVRWAKIIKDANIPTLD
jgi:tripartite-type tricarboxylate transporter receptor subunit TctC